MKIVNIRVLNFRCLNDVDIPCENLTALVGRNGTGKSTILKAIDIFFNVSYPITIEDYCNRKIDDPIEIILTFEDFTTHEKELFRNYIFNDKLIVSKKINWKEGKVSQEYYAKSMHIPDFASIIEVEGKRDQQDAIRNLINSRKYDGLSGTFRSSDQGLEILKRYEQDHPELTKLIESRFQFMGARNIGGGSLDNYTRFVLLPAVKEATEEVESRNSPIGQLINTIVSTEIQSREDLIKFTEDINQQILKVYSPENLGGLDGLAKDVTNLLKIYAPNSELKINWGQASTVKVSLPPIIYSLIEDDFEGDISNKGHGLQRALILTLLEYLAKIPIEIEGEERVRVDIILAIEEPEIYLHPSRCRYFANILSELSERGEDDPEQNRIQIIYSTHSPHFVGLDRFNSIRIIRKSRDEKTGLLLTTLSYYSLEEAAEIYSNICKKRRDEITRESFRVQTVPVMKPIVNEGFFADLIVLTEGPSDAGVLWKLQEIMDKEWEKKSIALLPAGGKSQLLKAAIIFRGLEIPTYIIFDLDADDPTTNRILSFFGLPPRYPEEFVHDTWACHELNLEDTLLQCVGEENYNRLWREVGTDLECNPDNIRKNEVATCKFTEITYEVGLNLEHCEYVVETITEYYQRELS